MNKCKAGGIFDFDNPTFDIGGFAATDIDKFLYGTLNTDEHIKKLYKTTAPILRTRVIFIMPI